MGEISSEIVNRGLEEHKGDELRKVLERNDKVERIWELVCSTGCTIAEAMDTLKIFNDRDVYFEILKNRRIKRARED